MESTHLVCIDPQNDFCHKNGSLSVSGADDDMNQLAAMIRRAGDKIGKISVTLDSHHIIDIAHPDRTRASFSDEGHDECTVSLVGLLARARLGVKPVGVRSVFGEAKQIDHHDRIVTLRVSRKFFESLGG